MQEMRCTYFCCRGELYSNEPKKIEKNNIEKNINFGVVISSSCPFLHTQYITLIILRSGNYCVLEEEISRNFLQNANKNNKRTQMLLKTLYKDFFPFYPTTIMPTD